MDFDLGTRARKIQVVVLNRSISVSRSVSLIEHELSCWPSTQVEAVLSTSTMNNGFLEVILINEHKLQRNVPSDMTYTV